MKNTTIKKAVSERSQELARDIAVLEQYIGRFKSERGVEGLVMLQNKLKDEMDILDLSYVAYESAYEQLNILAMGIV